MVMSAADVAKRRQEYLKGLEGTKGDWFKLEGGQTATLRIGPPWATGAEIWKDVFFHGRYPNKAYCGMNDLDPTTGKRRRCLVCVELHSLKGKKDPVSKKLYGLINQRSEGLWNVLVAKTTQDEAGRTKIVGVIPKFKIMRLAGQWHNELLDIFAEEDFRAKHILGVAHPLVGRFIRVRRTGTGMQDTEYKFRALDESPLAPTKELRLALLKTLNNLDKLVMGASDEELTAFLRGAKQRARQLAEGGAEGTEGDFGGAAESENGGGAAATEEWPDEGAVEGADAEAAIDEFGDAAESAAEGGEEAPAEAIGDDLTEEELAAELADAGEDVQPPARPASKPAARPAGKPVPQSDEALANQTYKEMQAALARGGARPAGKPAAGRPKPPAPSKPDEEERYDY